MKLLIKLILIFILNLTALSREVDLEKLEEAVDSFIENNTNFDKVKAIHIRRLKKARKFLSEDEDIVEEIDDYISEYLNYRKSLEYKFSFGLLTSLDNWSDERQLNLLNSNQDVTISYRGLSLSPALIYSNKFNHFQLAGGINLYKASTSSIAGAVEYHADANEVSSYFLDFSYERILKGEKYSIGPFYRLISHSTIVATSQTQEAELNGSNHFLGIGITRHFSSILLSIRLGKSLQSDNTFLTMPITYMF